MMITKIFIDWACSFSGCDGGNPGAKLWICGIEWGGGSKEYYNDVLPEQIQEGEYVPPKIYPWKETLKEPYGRNVAKLYTVIKGGNVEAYRDVAELPGLDIFKMNLYPIAFRNTDDQLWKSNGLDKLTGFEEKYLFKISKPGNTPISRF